MSALYSTKVTATGGRHGHIRSEDGLLDMKLALPRELGGKGDATNPETLFAGGYAACFENALLRVSREKGLRFADGDVEVIVEIRHSGQRRIQRRRCPGAADLVGGGCRRD
jgi:osmotically inducible protein OsmC